MNNAVLCVDIGTSSLKAAYISLKGDVLAFARIKLEKANESNRWLFALKDAISVLNQKVKKSLIFPKKFSLCHKLTQRGCYFAPRNQNNCNYVIFYVMRNRHLGRGPIDAFWRKKIIITKNLRICY